VSGKASLDTSASREHPPAPPIEPRRAAIVRSETAVREGPLRGQLRPLTRLPMIYGASRLKAEIAHIQKPAQSSHSPKIISLEPTGTVAGVAEAYLGATTNTFLMRLIWPWTT
jgi:hypothetical protein